MTRLHAFLLSTLALCACGDNLAPARDDAAPSIDAATAIDAAIDGPPASNGPCLDRPTDLPRPPTGPLPCDLLPPGSTARTP